jgi:hypothetical protein
VSTKKSESLEIRLPHALKEAFMLRCRREGRSASETIRDFIDGYLAPPPPKKTEPFNTARLVVAAFVAIALGAVAAPSIARPSLKATFARLDSQHLGYLSFDEFAAGASVETTVSLEGRRPRGVAFIRVAGGASYRDPALRGAFDRMDANHDGEISFDEFCRFYGD